MLKYITEKLIGQILPSVVATVIGAYVVNHYIIARPDTPPPAAKADTAKPGAAKPDTVKSGEAPAAAVNLEPPRAAAEAERPSPRPVSAAREKAADKAAGDKTAEKPAEKAAAKPAPIPETARSDDRRDAHDVVRAAVERLRAAEPSRPAAADAAAHAPEPPRLQEAPRAVALQPLPPPVTVVAPATTSGAAGSGITGSVAGTVAAGGSGPADERLSPPAEIPSAVGFGRDDAGAEALRRPSVAEDVLLAAKSVFHAVLPR